MKPDRQKPVLLSGIQPTGNLTIANYIGAIKNWVALQQEYDSLFILADLHAVTIRQDPSELRRRSLEFAALYLACGVDPDKSSIFLQSHVPGHTRLLWILNCFAGMGELNRMTQFKDKSGRQAGNINVGLFDYPVLMTADILLYGTDLVPVGDDQKQHLEFTRSIARRFNRRYGDIFNIPKAYIPARGGRIMGLLEPLSKMSKTDPNSRNYIAILDSPEAVRRKIQGAVTDPGTELCPDPAKPGISNLITLYAALSGRSAESIHAAYAGKGYARFKKDLTDVIIEFLDPLQKRYRTVASDPEELLSILRKGARSARERSDRMIDRVHWSLGFVPFS